MFFMRKDERNGLESALSINNFVNDLISCLGSLTTYLGNINCTLGI